MDKIDLVMRFIATQDAKQWEPAKLLEWANTMAELQLRIGGTS